MRRQVPRTPIVALTAHAAESQHHQCLAEGMDTVITKPVNYKALLRELGTVLANREPIQA
jgi:CheY-like chemotaxis protein